MGGMAQLPTTITRLTVLKRAAENIPEQRKSVFIIIPGVVLSLPHAWALNSEPSRCIIL